MSEEKTYGLTEELDHKVFLSIKLVCSNLLYLMQEKNHYRNYFNKKNSDTESFSKLNAMQINMW